MSVRTAHTAWTGGLPDGSGTVELVSSKSGSFDVSWPKRTAETGEAGTSPEELIAAAHSSCYAMQLSALIARAGGTPKSLDVTADVAVPDDQHGLVRQRGAPAAVPAALVLVVDEARDPTQRRQRQGERQLRGRGVVDAAAVAEPDPVRDVPADAVIAAGAGQVVSYRGSSGYVNRTEY